MSGLTPNGPTTSQSRIDRAIVGSLRGRDLSGFEIWRWLGSEQGTFGLLTESDLYPTLYRLEAERLLQSDWHEGDRIRRTYRVTAVALERADENAWPALPFRGTSTQPGQPVAGARIASPDPEAGSWFLPPRADPAEAQQLQAAESDRSGGADPSAGPASAAGAERFAAAAVGPRHPSIAQYVDELAATLDLPRIDRDRVRQEIADHLADSTHLLEQTGMDTTAAVTEAIDRIGNSRDLAVLIGRAQHSKERRDRAVLCALFELVGEVLLWLAVSAAAFAVGPGLADLIKTMGRFAGIHLVVLTSAEWATNQMAAMLCVGAFAAGRLSTGHLARISRHSDAAVRRRWAVVGALAVLAVALFLPGYPDELAVVTLLAAPLAFVAGTFRPKHQNEGAYTWRALGSAALFVGLVTLLPAGRLFAYDPSTTPGAPLGQGATVTELTVFQYGDGTFGYELPGTTTFVNVEMWPTSKDGLFIAVDKAAAKPTVLDVAKVDLAKLPPVGQWWVAAVVVGPDGQRTTRAVVIQTGASPHLSNALSWLIGRL
jgi:DNA-binding PadR family transcriptional regulator